MAHVSQEMKKELAPTIKAILKKYGIKGTLAVQHHSTLVLNIKSGQIDFIKNYNETRGTHVAKDSIDVNPYWFHEHFSGKAKSFLTEVIAAMKGPKYFDHSDSQSDYFHCSHYIDVNIGQWNKPYVFGA
jgi:hypothetical protein